jgi:hypothetical protein
VHQKIDSRRSDYGADEKWRSNLKIGGGFGWGIKFSSFGARQKRRLSPSKADLDYPTLVGYTPTIEIYLGLYFPECSGHLPH